MGSRDLDQKGCRHAHVCPRSLDPRSALLLSLRSVGVGCPRLPLREFELLMVKVWRRPNPSLVFSISTCDPRKSKFEMLMVICWSERFDHQQLKFPSVNIFDHFDSHTATKVTIRLLFRHRRLSLTPRTSGQRGPAGAAARGSRRDDS